MHHDTSFSGRFRAMRVLSTLPGGRSRRTRIAAAAAIVVALGATTAPVDAHDGDHDHGGSTGSPTTTACPPAKAKALKKAGDNFAKGCLPGEDIAQLDDSLAALEPGQTASSKNLELIANLPKQGAFDSESALNTDLAFQGEYAFAGNYNGFRSTTSATRRRRRSSAQVLCPGSQNDISVYGNLLFLATDSSRNDNSCNSTAQPRQREVVLGGHEDLRHQRQGATRSTSPRSRPLRFAHPHAGAGQGGKDRLHLRLVVLPERDLPGLPAAARQDLDHQGAA